MANVVCMKWGKKYGPEYVNVLHNMVRRNLTIPFRFACFTDDRSGIDAAVECFDIPEIHVPKSNERSPWRKLSLLSEKLADLEGPTLFLDLDIIVAGNLDCFFELPGEFCIIENWTTPGRNIGNSSVFRFNVGAHAEIMRQFETRTSEVLRQFPNEQAFMSSLVGKMTWWPDAWVRSFKRHCLPAFPMNWALTPKLPEGAKIIAFHGEPKPPDAAVGFWLGGGVVKHVRPTPWIGEYWK